MSTPSVTSIEVVTPKSSSDSFPSFILPFQVLAYLDNALDAATTFDEEQQYSRSMLIEPKEERRSRGKSLLKAIEGMSQ